MVKLRTLDELDDLERLALISMSYSRLDTYEMCNLKYYFTYIQKEERVFGPAATLGNVIHSVLEDTVGEPLVLDGLLERLDVHLADYDPDNQIDDKLRDAGRVMICEFFDRHEKDTFDVIGKELPFELVIGTGLVIGFIDLVTRDPDGTIRITDYKSGKWEVTFKDAPTNLQLGIYALAASILYPDTPIYAELYYLRSGRRKGHLFSPENLDTVYEEVLEKINTIIDDKTFLATQETRPCSFCDYRKTGACKVGMGRFRY